MQNPSQGTPLRADGPVYPTGGQTRITQSPQGPQQTEAVQDAARQQPQPDYPPLQPSPAAGTPLTGQPARNPADASQPRDGESWEQYQRRMFDASQAERAQATKTATTQQGNGPERYSGQTETEIISVETDRKRPDGSPAGGVDKHDIVLEHNGFGFWRASNLGPDTPWFKTRDDLIAYLKQEAFDGGRFEDDE